MSMDEYVRWLVTSELRVAMAYFDEVDALLKSKRQTPQEIDCCHPYKEFSDVVGQSLTFHKMKKSWKNMLKKVEDHIDHWLIRSVVIVRLEEYYAVQYSKYLDLTMAIFPTYIKCFDDESNEDVTREKLMQHLCGHMIPKAVFNLFGNLSGSDLEKQKQQWWMGFPDDPKYAGSAQNPRTDPEEIYNAMIDVERDQWYSFFPADLAKPIGPTNQRRFKSRCMHLVRKAIMLRGLTEWKSAEDLLETRTSVVEEVNQLVSDSPNGEGKSTVTVELSM